jgi:hypothetical protein
MALTGNIAPRRRGYARGDAFGYPAAPNEVVYVGGLTCINAAGQSQRVQTAGSVAFIGLATTGVNNSGKASAGDNVVASFDTYALTVTGATPSNIGEPVYATDDNTLTLAAPATGFTGKVGYLAGIDNGQTYVRLTNA